MVRFGRFFIDMVTGFVFVMTVGLLIVAPLPARRHPAVVLDTDGKNNVTFTAGEQDASGRTIPAEDEAVRLPGPGRRPAADDGLTRLLVDRPAAQGPGDRTHRLR
jgi:hypothetical protein